MSHFIRADLSCQRQGAEGAFEVNFIKARLQKEFPGVVVCESDIFDGYAEQIRASSLKICEETGKYPAVAEASHLGKITHFAPRYAFRIYSANGKWAEGMLDRYTVRVRYEDDTHFSPELQKQFRDFLESIDLGKPQICAGSYD
jgi:hypothetical protein